MKIVVDENISFGKEAFSTLGEVVLMHGREITNSKLKDTDVLIVRSITKVDEKLLDGTKVKFVGTATIGTDHIDLEYLKSKGIAFSDAKGCNADAVAEYVFTFIMYASVKYGIDLKGKSIGVVGVGNIGSRIVKLANTLGMKVLKNDPPVKRLTGDNSFCEFDEISGADFITLHVPLNKEGIDKTVHLLDDNNLEKLNDGAVLINASRGQVIDNLALNKIIEKKHLIVDLDVWETEPDINVELLKKVEIASPHIAGYSLEGKVNGTVIIYNALCRMLGRQPEWSPSMPAIDSDTYSLIKSDSFENTLNNIFAGIYDIRKDDEATRMIGALPVNERGKQFDALRKNYPLRREFKNYKIKLNPDDSEFESILKAFRFQITHSS